MIIKFSYNTGVYKTTEIHFFIPPPPSKIIFLSRLRHLVAAQWDTTSGGSSGIQHLGTRTIDLPGQLINPGQLIYPDN